MIFFCSSREAAEGAGAVLGALRLAAGRAEQSGQALVLLVLVGQGRLERREAVLDRFLLRALKREQLGELGQLTVQPRQHRVLAAHGLGDDEVGEHEQRHEEGHHQQQGGEHVDEARPVIGLVTSAAGARQRHYLRSSRAGSFALSVI